METPKIGQAPAGSLVDLAESVRDVANELLRIHEGDHDHVAEAREILREATAKLGAIASRHESPRAIESADKDGTRPYYFPGALAPRVHVAQPWRAADEIEGLRSRAAATPYYSSSAVVATSIAGGNHSLIIPAGLWSIWSDIGAVGTCSSW